MQREFISDSGMLFKTTFNKAIEAGFIKEKGSAVLTAGLPLGNSVQTNTIRIMSRDNN